MSKQTVKVKGFILTEHISNHLMELNGIDILLKPMVIEEAIAQSIENLQYNLRSKNIQSP